MSLTLQLHADVIRLQPFTESGTSNAGCLVSYVRPESPADSAGIKAGDIISEAGGSRIRKIEDLQNAVAKAGSELTLEFQRDDKPESTTANLGSAERGPRLGIACADMPSMPYTFELASATVSAQASMVHSMTLVRVHIANHSRRPVTVSPHLFSAADGNRLMLKLLEPSEVTTILQEDLKQATPPPVPESQYRNSMTPLVHTLGAYVFGMMGMKGNTAQFATAVAETISEGLAPDPSAYTVPPTITPAVVAREALTATELEPGYSVEGIVFFTAPKSLPITFMTKIDEAKNSIVFNTSTPITSEELGARIAPYEAPRRTRTSNGPIDAFFQGLDYNDLVEVTFNNGSKVHGKYDGYMDDDLRVILKVRSGIFLFNKTFQLQDIKDVKKL
jgi:hypothetical protein